MGVIAIEGMEFHAFIGCFDEEKIIGTRFVLDLFMHTDVSNAEVSDDLAQTINYQAVYQLIKEEMLQKHNLLERAANGIATRLMDSFAEIGELRLKIRKMHPPLGGQIASVSYEISRKR